MTFTQLTNASLRCVLFLLVVAITLSAQTANNLAPGAPGGDARWPSAGKDAVGTSNTLESKVWFTLRDGVMTEVYYPTVDVANSQVLQFVIVASNGKVETEEADTTHRIEVADARALSFRQINTAKSGAYTVTKTYTCDPERSTILIDVRFESRAPAALYVYFDPSLNNSGMHDTAWTQGGALLASDAGKTSALMSSMGLAEATNGYLGTSDGLTQLRASKRLTGLYRRASDGNVVQVARVHPDAPFTLALGFGKDTEEAITNARASLAKGFARTRSEYETGWHEYLASLRMVDQKYQPLFDMSAMVLRAHEDKTYRGAQIASLSVPWGGGASANEPSVGGYHLVWSRDLYQVATALYALGDKAGADRALNYLFTVQQKADGSFPQNSWLDGRPFWGSLQMDEVAFPLVLAYTLGRTDNETWAKHVKPAADFIVRRGPSTPQERWEEKTGHSPSTIAAEIAGLVCAAEIARRNDDAASAAIYLATADEWARNVERWTATTTGKHGDGTYYLRLSVNTDPNDGAIINAGNGGADYDEREYVDAGFLELVRLGIKRPDDPLIRKSVAVVDQVLKVETPNGPGWFRYNHDGYGEMYDGRPWNYDGKYSGVGHLWALLSGERGEYELARGETAAARTRLEHLLGFANDGLMIPEQVWDKPDSPTVPGVRFGEGFGSATPLAWSMAQFIRLAANVAEGRNVETPDIVAARYTKPVPPLDASIPDNAFPDDATLQRLEADTTLKLGGHAAPGTRLYALTNDGAHELSAGKDGAFELNMLVPAGESLIVVAAMSPNGATGFRRVALRGLTKDELRRAEIEAAPSKEAIARWQTATNAPVVEGEQVTFLYRGAAQQVEVAGDFTGWSPRGLFLRDVPGATNLKYLTRAFAPGTRGEYKLIVDGQWVDDPLNAQKIDNGVGGFNSFFTLPGYRPAAVSPAAAPASLRGSVEAAQVPTKLIEGGTRKLQVYLPPGYAQATDTATRYPVLYLQDGSDYLKRARAAEIADTLITEGKLAPFIIVFVDPANRMKEYWANDAFAEFMATELVPFIDARYRTQATRDKRALLGASLGGVISIWTWLKHPEMFARIGGQSSAVQIDDARILNALAQTSDARADRPTRFYLDVGHLEPIWEVNRRLRVLLAGKGYAVAYHEAEAGHNWTSWRDQLAEAYISLWAH